MITSQDILKATGLKSTKTLTRWHQRGLIPEPLVRTHPSGRGKMAYWPDWVLDRCVRIVELQKKGHSLVSAARVLHVEQWDRNYEEVKDYAESISELLASPQSQLGLGDKGTLLDAFHGGVLTSVEHLLTDPADRKALLAQLTAQHAVEQALNLTHAGYTAILVYDGEALEIIPDFLVGHRLSEQEPSPRPLVVTRMLPTLLAIFPSLDDVIDTTPSVRPAPKVWVQERDARMEYVYYPDGIVGFELLRETAKVVSTRTERVRVDADAGA
jgi:hypothetical protein